MVRSQRWHVRSRKCSKEMQSALSLKANAQLVALLCPPQQLAWSCLERQSSGHFPSSSSSRSLSSMAFLDDCHALVPRVQVIPWEKIMSTRHEGQGLSPHLTGILSHKGDHNIFLEGR